MENLPSHLVDLFDPANPAEPRRELAANFDPSIHVRWEHRPDADDAPVAEDHALDVKDPDHPAEIEGEELQ